jgi:Cysteine rich repeat
MLRNAFAIGTALLFLGSAAIAQDRAVARACAADIKALCAGIQPGGERIVACIKSNFEKLTEPCQSDILKLAAIRRACSADVRRFCAGTQLGAGRVASCMKPHLADVSDACKEVLAQASAGKN